MRKTHIGLLLLLSCIVFSCTTKAEKDKWAKEAPEVKYPKLPEVFLK